MGRKTLLAMLAAARIPASARDDPGRQRLEAVDQIRRLVLDLAAVEHGGSGDLRRRSVPWRRFISI